MSNYLASVIAGDSWQRSVRVIIDNQYEVVPQIHFMEEKIFIIDGEKVIKPLGSILETLSDPTTEFPLVNPQTGEALGVNSSYQEVYVILHSLYMFLALKRDEELANPIVP
jgi:hypothetical protein